MQIFIDKNNRCHTEPALDRRTFETPFFDGKCKEFVEGYVFVPEGESWTYNGITYSGELIVPIVPYSTLIEAQKTHEDLMKSYKEGVDSI